MLETTEVILAVVQCTLLAPLAILGLHRGWMLLLDVRSRFGSRAANPPTRVVPAHESDWPRVCVQLPIYNERDNVAPLHDALTYALQQLERSYEIVFVDDGSDDGSRDVMRRLAANDPHLRLVFFRRNYGQTAAMAAGFRACRGRTVVSMDGDLQNDPADIGRLVEKLEEGYDVVCGWRRNRQDRVATRLLPSRIANFLIARVTGARIHDTGCSLKVYRSWVVRS